MESFCLIVDENMALSRMELLLECGLDMNENKCYFESYNFWARKIKFEASLDSYWNVKKRFCIQLAHHWGVVCVAWRQMRGIPTGTGMVRFVCRYSVLVALLVSGLNVLVRDALDVGERWSEYSRHIGNESSFTKSRMLLVDSLVRWLGRSL